MQKAFLFLMLLAATTLFGQSSEITGTVLVKSDKTPLPGVTVLIKDTEIGTQTDWDGHFTITVPDSLKTLHFSYIGFKSKNYEVDNENKIEVFLKEDCNICFFDYQNLTINYFGGLKNAPKGFLLDIKIPLPIRSDGPLLVKYGYQTNYKANKQHYFEAGFPHFYADCGFIADLKFVHSNIKNGALAFDYKDYRIEAAAEFDIFGEDSGKIYAAYGTSQLQEMGIDQTYKGYELGLGKYFRYGFEVYAKTTFWTDFWQYQLGFDWNYRRYALLFQYNKIDTYDEFHLGVGFNIY